MCNLYEQESGKWQLTASYKGHEGAVVATAFLDSSRAVTAGGNMNAIVIWRWGEEVLEVRKMVGKGERICAVGVSDKSIAFTNDFTKEGGRSKLTRVLDLSSGKLKLLSDASSFIGVQTEMAPYTLECGKGGAYGFHNAVLNIKKEGEIIATQTRSATDGYCHNVYTFTSDRKIVSGGGNGRLYGYDLKGKVLTECVGHIGAIWGLAISSNGKCLISGSDDQTIMLWNLSDVGKKKKILPIVSIFIGSDGEWVMWHPSGYYDASAGGEKYIGWHINNGDDKTADFYPVASFRKKFYNPKLIAKLIITGDIEKARVSLGETDVADISKLSPPKIVWILPKSRSTKSKENMYNVEAVVHSESTLKEIKILLDGRSVSTKSVASGTVFSEDIKLKPGENVIEIFARNADAGVTSKKRIVIYTPEKAEK